jgi:hypothetical protein
VATGRSDWKDKVIERFPREFVENVTFLEDPDDRGPPNEGVPFPRPPPGGADGSLSTSTHTRRLEDA